MPVKKLGNITLFDVKTLSKKMGLSIAVIRQYMRTGRLRGRKMGREWYVTEDALRAYFEGRDQEPNEAPKVTEKK